MTDIIGIPAGQIIVGKSDFFRDDLGLERLVVEYYFRTSELTAIAGSVFKNGGSYVGSSSGNAVPVSSSTTNSFVPPRGIPNITLTGFSSLRIEKTDYSTLNGGISSAKVTYVGLLSSDLPAPKFEIIPIDDDRWIHYRFSIKATFITYLGPSGSFSESQIVQNRFGTPVGGSTGVNYILAPQTINGQRIPLVSFPVTRAYDLFYPQWFSQYGETGNLRWQTCGTLYASPSPLDAPGTQGRDAQIKYFGFIVSSCTVNRFGLFAIVSITMREGAVVYGFTPDGGGLGLFFPCASRLNV